MLVHQKLRLNEDKIPHTFGSPVGPFNPPLSVQKRAEYDAALSNIDRPVGGFQGCAYMGFDAGIICAHNALNSYTPNPPSFYSKWVSNVASGFPRATIDTPGGLEQIMKGGGAGVNPCTELCSCKNDPDCTCHGDSQGIQCGYESVNQNCMEPVPGGKYPSLAACEKANSKGYGYWPGN